MKITLAVAVVLLLAEGAAAQFTMQFSGDIVIPRDIIHQGTAMTMNGRTFNGNITLAASAVVGGDVWTANGRIARAPGAQVRGRIRAEVTPSPPPQVPAPSRPWDGMWYPWWSRVMRAVATMTLVGFVVLAALVTAVFPRQIRRVAAALSASPGEALLAGVALWILLPPLSVVLALSIVGIPAVVMLPFLVALVGLVVKGPFLT